MMAFRSELFPTFERPMKATSGSIFVAGVVRNLSVDHSNTGELRDGLKNSSAYSSCWSFGACVSQ